MYPAVCQLSMMDSLPLERRKAVLWGLTNFMAAANYQFLCEHPGTPRLYQVAPRYMLKVRPYKLDAWADLPTVYAQRGGDCKDFVAIRCAEEWRNGNAQAVPLVTYKRVGNVEVFHVQLFSNGTIEDPSELLGMPKTISPAQLAGIFR